MPEPLAVAFANTRFVVRGEARDALATPAELAAWLDVGGVGRAELAVAHRLRDAIRALFAGEDAAAEVVNEVLQAAPHWRELAPGPIAVRRSAAPPFAVALASIADDAVALLTAPVPVRPCGAPGCIRFFRRDHPRRTWCSERCANRVRAARHYARHR